MRYTQFFQDLPSSVNVVPLQQKFIHSLDNRECPCSLYLVKNFTCVLLVCWAQHAVHDRRVVGKNNKQIVWSKPMKWEKVLSRRHWDWLGFDFRMGKTEDLISGICSLTSLVLIANGWCKGTVHAQRCHWHDTNAAFTTELLPESLQ